MSMSFKGMEGLTKQLKELEQLGDRILQKALKAGAEVLREEIKKRAPRSDMNKEHLADNIIISKVIQGHIDIGPDAKKAFYARFVEFGTVNMPAQPFIEPAFLAVKDKIQAVMAEVVQEELKRL
ncbi:HK97-gp10 family putative phage morphogenesis protein [Priestia flexa]|uniref:HK97-gp10 family putative phage morphogenesis protein n=1 Tax=Priestia flexa TaxID=86664 RepID=UPI003D057930